jgi:hypothetical protein
MRPTLALAVVLGLASPPVGPRDPPSTPEMLEPSGVQSLYQSGVPHTDSGGTIRFRYDAASFFPRCIYHAVPGSLATIHGGGFNCVHTWEGVGIADVIGELRATGLQLIRHGPSDDEVRRFLADPRILGWYLDEEATSHAYFDMARTGARGLMAQRYQAFVARRAAIKALDPRHPVFPLDASYVPPGLGEWWDRWNSAGDVTAHDNYALEGDRPDFVDLARSVLRAARLNGERKPVWITLQAFGGLPGLGPEMHMPTAAELRGMALTAIVHGATGLILFAWDSRVTREGHILGIAPETAESYGAGDSAGAAEVAGSRGLWAGATALNAELQRLTPRLLSPTARLPYEVWVSGTSRVASPIRTMLKESGGAYTLLAVNLERPRLGARYQFPSEIAAVRRIEPDGQATAINADGRGFRDELGGLAAAVYEVRFR